MGVTYAIQGPIVEVTGEGAYTTADIAETLATAHRDPAWPSPALFLVDIRQSQITHTFQDIAAKLSLLQTVSPRVAFVVAGAAREYLAQIYRSRAEATGEIQVEVFSDAETARAWLRDPGVQS